MGENKPPGRWTAKERAALVMRILAGELSMEEAALDYGLKVARIRDWKNRFLKGAARALRRLPNRSGLLQFPASRLPRVGLRSRGKDVSIPRPTSPSKNAQTPWRSCCSRV